MKFVLYIKTNKDKSTEIVLYPFSLLHTILYINCTCVQYCAKPRAKKGQQKLPILKKKTGLCHSIEVIRLWLSRTKCSPNLRVERKNKNYFIFYLHYLLYLSHSCTLTLDSSVNLFFMLQEWRFCGG